jgi:hypothetical protein
VEERMNRTTSKHCQYDSHHRLSTHLADFLTNEDITRRLKTRGGHATYEYSSKI